MSEGWLDQDNVVLFPESEVASASTRYAIESYLPGMVVVGLRGWDDLLVRNAQGKVFTVPTVPLSLEHMAPYDVELAVVALEPDARFTGRIKWYVHPIVFAGSRTDPSNIIWVSHEQHGELVRWWNQEYRQVAQET